MQLEKRGRPLLLGNIRKSKYLILLFLVLFEKYFSLKFLTSYTVKSPNLRLDNFSARKINLPIKEIKILISDILQMKKTRCIFDLEARFLFFYTKLLIAETVEILFFLRETKYNVQIVEVISLKFVFLDSLSKRLVFFF